MVKNGKSFYGEPCRETCIFHHFKPFFSIRLEQLKITFLDVLEDSEQHRF